MRLRAVRLLLLSAILALAGGVGAARASTKVIVGHHNVAVAPVLDPSRSSSDTLGSGGGTLSTITADGTVLRLTLPRGALAGTERITMTPLKSLGQGGIKFVAGVQLAPAGLRLLKPGLLDVNPARTVAIARQAAFAYQDGGQQFGLVPFALRPQIEIPLLTLGGVGLARANAGQLAARAADRPSDPQSAWLEQLAIPLYKLRDHVTVAADRQLVVGLLASFYSAYVKPLRRGAGTSIEAWTQAAVRSVAWEREVQSLGYARRFAADFKRLRSTVFGKALRKRWRLVTSACGNSQQTLTRLRNALALARTAQRVGAGSKIGGGGAITAGIQSCAALGMQAYLGLIRSNWQSGLSSTYLSAILGYVQTASTPLALQQALGGNEFSFASPHTGAIERLVAWTLAPVYAAEGCSQPAFMGFTTDPNQMYVAFGATLTVPADLFEGAAPPPPTAALIVSGSDLASWSVSCPHGTTSFSQAPGAVAGVGAITGLTPLIVPIATTSNTQKLVGSADIFDGTTITGTAVENGTITVVVPS